MTCDRCGRPVSEHDLFCPRCGTPLAAAVIASTNAWAPTGSSPEHLQPATRPRWRGRRRNVLVAVAILCLIAGVAAALAIGRQRTVTGHAIGPAAATTKPRQAAGSVTTTVTASPSPSATPSMDFATIYAREQSGVVRIETLSCSNSGIGTGFLLTPTLIATVEHVIDESVVVSLIDGTQRTTGTVIGTDPAHDLALIQANQPLHGYHFRFAATTPRIGDQVAAIGFPIGDPITLTHGDVSGLNRPVTVNGTVFTGLIETDAAINPGNSGGPLLTTDGTVVGLVDALNPNANGIAYAVPATQAAPATRRWRQVPNPTPPATCPNPLGPAQAQPDVPSPTGGQVSDSQAAGIVAAFNTYFGGINTGNYAEAFAVLSRRLRANLTEQQFADGDATSYDSDITVLDAQATDATTVTVALAFTSLQTPDKGPNGDSCDHWTLLYTLIQNTDGSWLIDRTQPYNGPEHTTC